MRLSNKQKQAIEKISGKKWDSFSAGGIEAFFAATDRGEDVICNDPDFRTLLEYHQQHPVTVEMWRQDFKKGLLFLRDFLLPELPAAYIRHAFEIYEGTFHFMPTCYRTHPLTPEAFRLYREGLKCR